MLDNLASIGDGAINLASGAMDASASMAKDLGLGSRGFNDALTAMTEPMKHTPSIAQFLMKVPLSIG